MEKQSSWKVLLSGADPVSAHRLNDAADEVNALRARNAELHKQVASLFELDKAQGVEIARLQSAVWVLMQMLADAKVLDGDVLMARVKKAFDELEHGAQGSQGSAPSGQTPYRG